MSSTTRKPADTSASPDHKRKKAANQDEEEEDSDERPLIKRGHRGDDPAAAAAQKDIKDLPVPPPVQTSPGRRHPETGYPMYEGPGAAARTSPDKGRAPVHGMPPISPSQQMGYTYGPMGPSGSYSPNSGPGMMAPYFVPGPGMHGMHVGGYYPAQQQYYGGPPYMGMGGNFGMGGYPGYFSGYPGGPLPGSTGGGPSPNAASGNMHVNAQSQDGPEERAKRLTGRSPEILYLDCDADSLSPYQCLVRQQIELFEAKDLDVDSNAQGRNKPIVHGQVGIRCRHCSSLPPRHRARASVYYPAKLDGLYQAAQNMANIHLCQHCQHIPQSLKTELLSFRVRKSSAGGGKKYWGDGARAKGVYECDDGLRFEPLQQQPLQPPPQQQQEP